VRNYQLQEGKKHDQATFFAKAEAGDPRSAKQKDEELTGMASSVYAPAIGNGQRV
jgi:hypothetical protein